LPLREESTLAPFTSIPSPRAAWCRVILVASLGVACGSSTSAPPNPLSATTLGGDWPVYGHDASRTNCNSGETAISLSTVSKLAPAWQFDVGLGDQPTSSGPVVSNGVVYVGSSVFSGNNYFALNAKTGALVWSADLGHPGANGPFPCGDVGIGSTGAVSGGVLAVGGGDSAYYGLDPVGGSILWRHPLNAGTSAFPWESPLIAQGRVYVGIASGCDNPVVLGELRALDANSGTLLASKFFAPLGQPGAGVWNSPALSPDASTLFVVTGEDNGTNDPYAQAMLSLDPQSLSILGVNKQGPIGDDLDFATSPVVFSDETGRVLVGASQKTGFFYAFLAGNVNAGPVWSRGEGVVIGLAPAYDPAAGQGGTLFFGATGGQNGAALIRAVDPSTGADRYAPMTVGEVHGNIAVANGLLYVNAGNQGVLVFNDLTGEAVATLAPAQPGSAVSGVTIASGSVYWLSGSILNAWRIPGS
jgi:outer membrane protein assembly factor BamB